MMDNLKTGFKNINDYFNAFPEDVREILESIRAAIKEEVPDAEEAISYQMPTFKLNGKNLVHFAAWKSHIGFYPTPSGTEEFKKELSKYKVSKGAIQLPINKPLPLELIRKIVRFRMREEKRKDN